VAKNDIDWHSEIALEIGPHPEILNTQRRAMEMDYGMVDGKIEIVLRKALWFSMLRRLDPDPVARKLSN